MSKLRGRPEGRAVIPGGNKAYSPGLGRWVEVVETVIPGTPTRTKQHRQDDPFALIPLRWAEEAAKTGSPSIIVFVNLIYLSWKTKSPTVTLSNRDGVNRWAKDRVLRNFEAAGLIRVERRNGRSPRVTILHWQPWLTCTKTTR